MSDGFRISNSSLPSNSSQGSGPDDCESLGDVYVWGEVWTDGADGCSKTDVMLPKLLESNVVLDVQHIACGVHHAALVTRQGEVFSWGENNSGRLGHGHEMDGCRPQLIESLTISSIDYVACGEYHSCAVSASGDLYTWGNDALHAGYLGHGMDASHWIPKRICGPLEGFQVLFVSCGSWHSAVLTSGGRLFTFGDGTFGALGHGNRDIVAHPREVESLNGLRTIRVACGVWHTAAIVEIVGQAGSNVMSRKLFTWGDGDKHCLGHGDKEPRLVPTCVSSLIDYNFHQLACGHALTVALTTSGHVFTMGSTCHGQLGNPHSDGVIPCVVQDRLVGESIEEIACGMHHVAVLTSRSEVFTWGKGANGRLGHGDTEDRKTPTLVEALKDRHIKSIACGSNFMTSICIHKWVSSADQSFCSGCRQSFGFTRKRHNCYNCGLVHCHACSSKKVLRAALAPTPRKPHRVCDLCYLKLKAPDHGSASSDTKKGLTHRRSMDLRERSVNRETRLSRALIAPLVDPLRQYEPKILKLGTKEDSLPLSRVPVVPSLLQLKDISIFGSISVLQAALKPVVTSASPPGSRSTSPYSTRPTSPRPVNPMFPKSAIDNLKKTNELLNQEVLRLQSQVKNLRQRCESQDTVIQRYERRALERLSMDEEEYSRLTSLGIDKSMVTQKMDAADDEMPGTSRNLTETTSQDNGLEVKENRLVSRSEYHDGHRNVKHKIENNAIGISPAETSDSMRNTELHIDHYGNTSVASSLRDPFESRSPSRSRSVSPFSNQSYTRSANVDFSDGLQNESTEIDPRSPKTYAPKSNQRGKEVIEQFEPGVYITMILLPDGTKFFKRVRFSKRRFAEQQAEGWWKENQEKVFKKYIRPTSRTTLTSSSVATSGAEANDVALS